MGAQGKPQNRTRSCLIGCLGIMLIAGCTLACLAAGGYWLYTSGTLTRRDVQNALGFGYGEIMVTNITEDTLRIEMTRLDTEDGEPAHFNTVRAEPLDRAGMGGLSPGRYLLELAGSTLDASCTLQIESGDAYQLVVVPEGTAITRKGYEPTSADELDLATTSLCRR